MLPISNKTILQDSKILGVVEKWSKITIEEVGIPSATTTVKDKDLSNDVDNKNSGSSTPVSSGDASVKIGMLRYGLIGKSKRPCLRMAAQTPAKSLIAVIGFDRTNRRIGTAQEASVVPRRGRKRRWK